MEEQNETHIHPVIEKGGAPEPVKITPLAPQHQILTLPVAIVIAGVLIAGSVVYSNVWAKNNLAAIGAGNNNANAPKTYTANDLKKWAKDLKLDTKKFNQCLDSGKYAQNISDSTKLGNGLGVGGTPSSFISGIVPKKSVFVQGALPYDMFNTIINQYVSIKTTLPAEVLKLITEVSEVAISADDHAIGNADAPVTIIEYSDFQCPYCEAFFTQTLSGIKKNMVDTGKVRFIFRNFPLSQIHPMAEKFAEAAECANDQGKFWDMHDTIFTKQAE